MKKTFITIGTALLFTLGSATFVACGEAAETHEHEREGHDHDGDEHATDYQCPMQCEGDKTYAEAGKCPKCKMDLEALAEHGHEHDHDGGHEH